MRTCLLFALALALAVASCENHINSNYDALKTRAGEVLGCPVRELRILEVDAKTRDVLCGSSKVTYIWDGYLWVREGEDAAGLCGIDDPDCVNVRRGVRY